MDPLSVLSLVTSTLSSLSGKYLHVRSLLSDAVTRLRQTEKLLTLNSLEVMVGADVLSYVGEILGDLQEMTERLERDMTRTWFGVPVGKAQMCAGAIVPCAGSARWAREISEKIDDLEYAMDNFNTRVNLTIADAAVGGVSRVFKTTTQQRFWRDVCQDRTEMRHEDLARELRNLTLTPMESCLHVATGIMPGRGVASPQAVAASMGDMSPRSWVRSMVRGPSKTTAFAGHSEQVTSFAVSGEYLATCSEDRTVKVFRKMVLQKTMVGHERGVLHACFAGDVPVKLRPLVYSCSSDHSVCGWNVFSGERAFCSKTGTMYPESLAATSRGVYYTLRGASSVTVLDPLTGELMHTVSPNAGPLSCLAVWGDRVFVGTSYGSVVSADPAAFADCGPRSADSSRRGDALHRAAKPRASLDSPLLRAESMRPAPLAACGHKVVFFAAAGGRYVLAGTRQVTVVGADAGGSPTPMAVPSEVSRLLAVGYDAASDWVLCVCKTRDKSALFLQFRRETGEVVRREALVCTGEAEAVCAAVSPDALYVGWTDGSTTGYCLRSLVDTFHVVGCRYMSTYLPEVSSDDAGVKLTVVNSSVVVGPRQGRKDHEHGILANSRSAAFVWCTSDDTVHDATSLLNGYADHCSLSLCSDWLLCRRNGWVIQLCSLSSELPYVEVNKVCELECSEDPKALVNLGGRVVAVVLSDIADETDRIALVDVAKKRSFWVCNKKMVASLSPTAALLMHGPGGLFLVSLGESGVVEQEVVLEEPLGTIPLCACQVGARDVAVLTPGSILLVRGALGEAGGGSPVVCKVTSVPCHLECNSLYCLRDRVVLASGFNGRSFVIDLDRPERAPLTYVTHPSHLVHSQVAQQSVLWDAKGALLVVSL